MKGVILAGGFGTRLKPATNVTNKHLLPLYVKDSGAIPMLHYPINTLKNSGITEILIITSQEHCGDIIENFGDGKKLGVDLTYKIQDMYPEDKVTGIAQALKLAETFVCGDCFAVVLGDNYFEDTFTTEFLDFEKNAKYFQENTQKDIFPAAIFLKHVPDPQRFGVATLSMKGRVISIAEKPEKPETDLAVTGLYLFTSHVFSLLPLLKPSRRNELEITDINNHYVKIETMKSYFLKGTWLDMGTPESIIKTQEFLNAKIQK